MNEESSGPCDNCFEPLLDKDEDLFGNMRLCRPCASKLWREFDELYLGRPLVATKGEF